MKKYITLALLIIILGLVGNNYYQTRLYKAQKTASVKPVISQPIINQPEQRRLAVINIGGFGCPSCPVIAENVLKDTQGVIDAKTTTTGEGSRVLYDASIVTIDDLKKALGSYTIDITISDQPSEKDRLD